MDSKQLIPGPFVSCERDIQRSADGTARQRGWRITVKGKLTATKGSPDRSYGNGSSDPLTWFYTGSYNPPATVPTDPSPSNTTADKRLAQFRDKMGALTALLEKDGQWFEIAPFDGSASTKFQIRTSKISFAEGPWFNTVDYTIEMETDCLYFGSVEVCGQTQVDSHPEETWSLEQGDELGRTFRLTHTVSATSRKRFNADSTVAAEGWEVARDMVLGGDLAGAGAVNLLGFDAAKLTATGVLNLSGFLPFNHVRSQQIDEGQGKFSVTEIWLCFNPNDNFGDVGTGHAIEDLQVETRYSAENGQYTVGLHGTITGLEERDANHVLTKSRYSNALDRFNPIYGAPSVPLNRAQTYSGITLNPIPISSTVARNDKSGVITYTVEYNDRAAPITAGALSEVISVDIENPADVFAAIGVIGRLAGPVLQDIGSKTEKSITVSANIIVPSAKYGQAEPTMPTFNTLAVATPLMGTITQLFVRKDTVQWVGRNGRFSRSSIFVFQ